MKKTISLPIAITIIVACAVLTGVIAWQCGFIPGIGPSSSSPTPPVDETASWKTHRNEKYGFEIKYPAEWGEPRTDEFEYEVAIAFEPKIKFISISSLDQIREKYSEEIPGPTPGSLGLYGNSDLLERHIQTLEQIAESGEIISQLEEKIKKPFNFVLMSGAIDSKYKVESIYLDNLNIWGLKLIGYDSYEVTCCDFYYRVTFIKDDKLVKIYFDGLAALPGYPTDYNYEELSNNFAALREDYKIALENNTLDEFNPELAKEFRIYDTLVKSIGMAN